MPGIAETIRRFQAGFLPGAPPPADRLERLSSFGSNPGALDAWIYAPAAPDAALVVVLHGCTQTAAGYDLGSGWSALAERFGFALLFPEQQRANNANLCFNWFSPDDVRRDSGEVLSIRQMIGAVTVRHRIDPARVFVTGLSAGGAMANAMLATYPELFAGGAIIAGLPYGAAASVPEAFARMRGEGHAAAAASAATIRHASPHRGRWPSIAVWHGAADATVDVVNGEAIVEQWRAIHGATVTPDRTARVDGHAHRVWTGADGSPAVEDYRIAGLGHGVPLKTGGTEGCGIAGAYMLEAGISSTRHQAQSWGLLERPAVATKRPQRARPSTDPGPIAGSLLTTIETALRSAGLK